MKQILFVIVAAFLSVAAVGAQNQSVPESPDGLWSDFRDSVKWSPNVEQGIVYITGEREFAQFAWLVNEKGHTFKDTVISLSKSLDLSAHYWVPVGWCENIGEDGEKKSLFQGVFNGKGNTISGLYITTDTLIIATDTLQLTHKSALGLFGCLGGGAQITNLTLQNGRIEGRDYSVTDSVTVSMGAFAGLVYCNDNDTIKISYCHNGVDKGDKNVSFVYGGDGTTLYVGGVVGHIYGSDPGGTTAIVDISECWNYGSIDTVKTGGRPVYLAVGGILGASISNFPFDEIDQLLLDEIDQLLHGVKRVSISSCQNHGAITGDVNDRGGISIGGIMGCGRASITYCKNDSPIKRSIHADDRYANIGGIAGSLFAYGENNSVSRCQNDGLIHTDTIGEYRGSGLSATGGIIGFLANEDVSFDLSSLVNRGNVTGGRSGRGGTGGTGGIIGYILNADTIKVHECFNYSGIVGVENVGNVSGGSVFVGGIIGHARDGDKKQPQITITSCQNSGSLSGEIASRSQSYDSTIYSVGGIIGGFNGAATSLSLESCHNQGHIREKYEAYAGGLIGSVFANEIKIKDTYSNATLSLFEKGGAIGGLIGSLSVNTENSFIRDSYSAGKIDIAQGSSATVGGIIGKSVLSGGEYRAVVTYCLAMLEAINGGSAVGRIAGASDGGTLFSMDGNFAYVANLENRLPSYGAIHGYNWEGSMVSDPILSWGSNWVKTSEEKMPWLEVFVNSQFENTQSEVTNLLWKPSVTITVSASPEVQGGVNGLEILKFKGEDYSLLFNIAEEYRDKFSVFVDGKRILPDTYYSDGIHLFTKENGYLLEIREVLADKQIEILVEAVAVEDVRSLESLKLYTENGSLHIETAEATQVAVYTLTGQKKYEKVVSGNASIGLAKGLYIVKAGNKTRKVILK